MNELEEYIHIPKISKNINFWMLRTKRSAFYYEYITKSYIAIGWNIVLKNNINNEEDRLKNKLEELYPEKHPKTSLNKCHKFIFDLKENDIVLIIGDYEITFAKVGKYYEESNSNLNYISELEAHKQIENNLHKTNDILCPYVKRRKIEIIGKTNIYALNPYLSKAIYSNHHSLSSLNDYAELILNACYGIYVVGNKLSLTFHIDSEEKIDAISFSNFTSYLIYLFNKENTDINLTTALNSPGDISFQFIFDGLTFIKDNLLYILVIYIMIFGGKIKSKKTNFEITGLLGHIKKIYKKIKYKEINELKYENEKTKQKITKKELEIKELELNKEFDQMIKKADELQLLDSVQKLNVRPANSNIIQIEKFIQDNEDNTDDNT